MPVKTKRTTGAKELKRTKTPAPKAIAKKAKKPAAKKTAKKAVAKSSIAEKTIEKQKHGKPAKTSSKKAVGKRAPKIPKEKMAWRISPEISQSVLQRDTWKKADLKIEHLKVYRSGWIIVDQLPDFGGYNPDEGINIFEEFQFDEHQLYDGSEEASIFPNELPVEERERLLALSEAELEDEGWTLEFSNSLQRATVSGTSLSSLPPVKIGDVRLCSRLSSLSAAPPVGSGKCAIALECR